MLLLYKKIILIVIIALNAQNNRLLLKLLCLEYYCLIFVTLILTSGLPDPVFKNKKMYFPSTKVYDKNCTENISPTEQFEH